MKFYKRLILLSCLIISSLNIKAQCDVSFSADTLHCFGDSIIFSNSSNIQGTWNWNFGDPFSGIRNTDTNQNPSHKFTFPGLYSVRLIGNDVTNNCTDTFFLSVRVMAKPSANFTIQNACISNQIEVFNSNASSPFDSILKYSWSWGNGDTANIKTPIYSYQNTGNFNVKLKIETYEGCLDSITKTISVRDQPIINFNADTLCKETNVSFSVNTGSSAALSYLWNFGDGSSSILSSPLKQYNQPGYFYPNVRVSYSGSNYCFSAIDSIYILELPFVDFALNDSIQCFKGNQICISMINQPTNLNYRAILFGDGNINENFSPNNTSICYNYGDSSGGIYSISVELSDSNGCSNSLTKNNIVQIYPIFNVDFETSSTEGCFKTDVNFINKTNQSPPDVVQYQWDLGDGTFINNIWSNITHSYTSNGSFTVKLIAENDLGCIDSLVLNNGISNTSFSVDAKLDSIDNQCRSTNIFYYSQTPISGGNITWYFGFNDSSNSWNVSKRYVSVGNYSPFVIVRRNNCDSTITLPTASVIGPQAAIGNVINGNQCSIQDTVYVSNLSSYFGNNRRLAIWDFNDPFASNCTTDVANGINLNSNCNFWIDSNSAKHRYANGQEGCYAVRLIAYDPDAGCYDTIFRSLALQAPDASPSTNPFRPGLILDRSQTCLGPEEIKTVRVNLGGTQPSCARDSYWVMWDSTCAAQSGNFNSFWESNPFSHNYNYTNKPCDPDGWVTIGLIIRNGSDSNGNVCYDTAWYHKFLKYNALDPRFISSYNPNQYYCKGESFSFSLIDSTQGNYQSTLWSWGDGNQDNNLDSSTRYHSFDSAGSYLVSHTLQNIQGCIGIDTLRINIGVEKRFNVEKYNLCKNEIFNIQAIINYWGNSTNYWDDPQRKLNGFESIQWDFGDGSGFRNGNSIDTHSYQNIGEYFIKAIIKDSIGCVDTFYFNQPVKVYGLQANFSTPNDTLVCAQVVPFTNLSNIIDSLSSFYHSDDSIIENTWAFRSNLQISRLKNPFRYLNPDNYLIKLKIKNTIGCLDSIEKPLIILGPKANFEFIGDSSACQNSTISFNNLSTDATTYIWRFGDSLNNTLITNSDSNIVFKYENWGTFYPSLSAQGSIVRNGINITCSTNFPDSLQDNFREILIFQNPNPSFTWQSGCINRNVQFNNTSAQGYSPIVNYLWDFGDGNTSPDVSPTHTYSDTGRYIVILKAYDTSGCTDSIFNEIIVAPPPKANFTFNEACFGSSHNFIDSSLAFNDIIYEFQWNLGDQANSNLQNPQITFDSAKSYEVSLKVTNTSGCSDSISKAIVVRSFPNTSFSVIENCEYDSIIFHPDSNQMDEVNYSWKIFDDQNNLIFTNLDSSFKIINNDGLYTARLSINSIYNCKDSTEKLFNIFPKPNANFTLNENNQCLNSNSLIINNNSNINSGFIAHKWYFGNGDSSDLVNPIYNYSDTGSYHIQLILTSDKNCYDSLTDTVNIFENPKANFISKNLESCFNIQDFEFIDSSFISKGNYTRTWIISENSNYSDSIINPSFTNSGIKTVKLIVNSNSNCNDSFEINIEVNPKPNPQFNINDSDQCLAGNLFEFSSNNSIDYGNYSIHWDFGDASSDTQENSIHSYQRPDTFLVNLTLISNKSCIDSFSKNIIVFPMPISDFSVNNDSQCLRNNLFEFQNSSNIPSGSLSFNWNFGDNILDTSSNPSHYYINFGNYSIQLISTSDQNCQDTLTKPIKVHPMPQVDYLINDSNQCVNNQSFEFTDLSSIPEATYNRVWDFGDNSNDTAQQNIHFYSLAGIYNASLLIVSEFNCRDSQIFTIEVYPKPESKFSLNDTFQCLKNNEFIIIDSSQIESGTFTYNWTSGDGQNSNLKEPNFSYNNFGNYSLKQILQSNNGCLDSNEIEIEVYPMPIADYLINDSNQCLRANEFIFTNNSQIPNGSFTNSWYWTDTTQSTIDNPNKSFLREGQFQSLLVVVSDKNCYDSLFKNLEVYPQPKANFSINDSTQCFRDHEIVLNNLSQINSGSLTYSWDFGDNQNSNQNNPSHNYQSFGNYTVELSVSSNFNCFDTLEKNVEIYPMPSANFEFNDSTQCINIQNFLIDNQSNIASGTLEQNWLLSNGFNSNLFEPQFIFNQSGNYWIRLIENSNFNCKDTVIKTFEVYPKPYPDFSINDETQCLNINQFVFQDQGNIDYGTYQNIWDFGDGSSAQSLNTQHIYSFDGSFIVKLLSISNNNCTDSISYPIIVYPKTAGDLIINDSDQCINTNRFIFTDNSSVKNGTVIKWWWNLDTGFFRYYPQVTHIYNSYGIKNVIRVTENNFSCLDTFTQQIEVFPKPKADFLINDSAQCENNNLFIFNNTSSIPYGNLSAKWLFGNGDSSLIYNSVYIYPKRDTLDVILISESDQFCYDTTSRKVILFPKPEPDFSIDNINQCLNSNQFNLESNSLIFYGRLNHLWDFGDSSIGSGLKQNKVYNRFGNFDIKLKNTSDLGCSDSIIKSVTVWENPIPKIYLNDFSQCQNVQNFIFIDSSFVNVGPLNSVWDVEKVGIFTDKIINPVFNEIGLFRINLKSYSLNNCESSIDTFIHIHSKPQAKIFSSDTQFCLNNQKIDLIDISSNLSGEIHKRYWEDESNLITDSAKSFTSIFTESGIHKIKLKVISDSNCIDSTYQYFRIFPLPKADYTVNDSAQCLSSNDYLFVNTSFDSIGLVNRLFNYNEIGSIKDSFKYSFNDTGFKSIRLIVENNYSCFDSIEKQVYVKAMPNPNFNLLKDFYCNNENPLILIPNIPGGIFSGVNVQNDFLYFDTLWNRRVKYEITVNGCTDSSIQTTRVYPTPTVDIGSDTQLCKKEFIPLDVSFWESEYLWHDGSTSPKYLINSPGKYFVRVKNICGEATDTIHVSYLDENCRIYIPNAFSPNNDLFNDYYKPYGINLINMNYKIYTRWGELIYSGDLNSKGWDGTYNGSPVQVDVYLVYIEYSYSNRGNIISEVVGGNVQLLR